MSPLLRDASLSAGSGSAGSASLCMDSGEMLRLLRAHDAHQAQHRLRAREDLHEPRPALYLTAHALLNVVAAYAPAVLRGEVEVGQGVGLGLLEERTRAGRQRVHRVDGSPVGRPRAGGVRPAEDGLHRPGRHRPMALGGQQGANVALEVDDTALPAGGRQALGDRACEASVGVAGDEADAREPALAQAAQEAELTGVGLGVDRRDTEYAAHAVGADADRGGGRGRLDAAAPPAPHIRRVEEQVGRLDSGQTARRELADLGVERPAHGADLVLREPLYAHLAAIRSIFLVDTPLAHDSAPAAAAALSARE